MRGRLAAVLGSLVLALAGCGGGGDGTPAAGAEPGPNPRPSASPARSPSPQASPTRSPSPQASPSRSPRPSASPQRSPSPGPSASPARSPSPVPSPSPAQSPTLQIVGFGHFGDEPARGSFPVEAVVRHRTPEQVDFFLDGELANTDARWPYMLWGSEWDSRTVPNGEHRLRVVARFPDGATLEEALDVEVGNPPDSQRLLWIDGELVYQPHTLRVDRQEHADGSISHTVSFRVPSRGWDVRFTLPSTPYTLTDGNTGESQDIDPEHEPHQWVSSVPDPGRFEIERLVADGIVFGRHWPLQGASDPCANGSWRPGDPPRQENRHGRMWGRTETLTPVAEGAFRFWGVDDRCRDFLGPDGDGRPFRFRAPAE